MNCANALIVSKFLPYVSVILYVIFYLMCERQDCDKSPVLFSSLVSAGQHIKFKTVGFCGQKTQPVGRLDQSCRRRISAYFGTRIFFAPKINTNINVQEWIIFFVDGGLKCNITSLEHQKVLYIT